MHRYLLLCAVCLTPFSAVADTAVLDAAISQARIYCLGLSDELNHLKTMAGINTAVTGVGTAVGVGATAVGIAKSSKDKEIEELEKYVAELRELGAQQEEIDYIPPLTDEEYADLVEYSKSISSNSAADVVNVTSSKNDEQLAAAEEKLAQETAKSKNLGNWRTGLLAANTATNVAGAVIASQNKVDDELQEQIDACVERIKNLSTISMQARAAGDVDANQMSYVSRVVSACGTWELADLAKINAKAKAATISSSVGAGVGFVGTIVSAVANTDKTRNDNTESGKQKEKNLNTAANVMAGSATVASGVATIFNATQIGAIKRAVNIAAECEEAL